MSVTGNENNRRANQVIVDMGAHSPPRFFFDVYLRVDYAAGIVEVSEDETKDPFATVSLTRTTILWEEQPPSTAMHTQFR